METKLKAKEILDYVLTALQVDVSQNTFLGINKKEYNLMLKEISFMIDND